MQMKLIVLFELFKMSNDKFASVQFDCGRMEGYSSAGSVWWYIFIIIASLQGAPLCLSSESKTSKESDGLRGRRRVEGGGWREMQN